MTNVLDDNAIMFWHDGTQYRKITDHGRSPLQVSIERIEKKQRMADGTLRRHSICKEAHMVLLVENYQARLALSDI